jgi:uncharacterized protein YbjT (DUF2867 family)
VDVAKTYVVAGATGRQGGATAHHLRKAGHRVIGVTHTPSKAAGLQALGIEPRIVDVRDSAQLVPHLQGVDGFFAVTDPFAGSAASPDISDWVEDEIRQGDGELRAAHEAKVPHVVLGAVSIAAQEHGAPFHKSKVSIEKQAKDLGLPLTILRPPFYMETWLPGVSFFKDSLESGRMELPLKPDTPVPHIDPSDVGRAAVWSFEHPELSIGEAWDLVGEVTTIPAIARTLSMRWGRTFAFSEVPAAPGDFPMFAPMVRRDYTWDAHEWEAKFGFRMTTFEEFVSRLPAAP